MIHCCSHKRRKKKKKKQSNQSMEEPQSAQSQSGKLVRYALRSATKTKEEKPAVAELSNSSASKRGRPASTVSKSVGVLDLSGKDKSAKPPRRLSSIPTKSAGTPVPKLAGNITPVSEARSRRSVKSETPASDVSKSISRKKFDLLSSPSYWLSQIKLSEASTKHSISLGFFKLAFEAGCEPLQPVRDELKSYKLRHKDNLGDLGKTLKGLLESYKILENEELQVSETCSQVFEEGTRSSRSSDDDVKSCSSTMGTRKLKPKSLNTDAAQVSSVTVPAKKEIIQKSTPATRARGSVSKSSSNSGPVSETGVRRSTAKKSQKPSMQESNDGKDRKKKQGNKSAGEQVAGSVNPTPAEEEALNENKENEDAPSMEEISLA